MYFWLFVVLRLCHFVSAGFLSTVKLFSAMMAFNSSFIRVKTLTLTINGTWNPGDKEKSTLWSWFFFLIESYVASFHTFRMNVFVCCCRWTILSLRLAYWNWNHILSITYDSIHFFLCWSELKSLSPIDWMSWDFLQSYHITYRHTYIHISTINTAFNNCWHKKKSIRAQRAHKPFDLISKKKRRTKYTHTNTHKHTKADRSGESEIFHWKFIVSV